MTDEEREQIERNEMLTAHLLMMMEARKNAQRLPERPPAKVLQFKPRTT